jgi:ATP-dependent Lon protease
VLIDLIRRKVRLNQPYIGIFLKKEDDNKSEVVQKLSDVYEIGSFAQIQEMQDLGDKLRLVVTAHRRVKIVGQLIEDLEEVAAEKRKSIFHTPYSRLHH